MGPHFWQIGTSIEGLINRYVDRKLIASYRSQPTTMSVRQGMTDFAAGTNVIKLPTSNVWTYWVITQGGGVPFDVNIPHPIHLHGHDFYILGAGSSGWTDADREGLNYENPIRRDVAMLPANGWLAVAFLTNNPGAWLFHCHIVCIGETSGS